MALPTERTFLATAGSSGGRVIPTPFEFFTTGEDNLRVISANAKSGVSLKINMRFVDTAGTITATSWDQTPNTDRSLKTTDYPLGRGAVMNVTVHANAGAPSVGQTFVIVQLIRGLGPAAIVLGTLLQGYVTTTQGLGWPGSPILSSTDGEPIARTVGGTLPPIGVEVSETVPVGARWELLSLTTLFVTSAAVPTRRPRLRYASGADFIGFYPHTLAIGPGAVTFITWGPGLVPSADAAQQTATVGLPNPMRLLAGQQFSTLTGALDVGDSYQAPIYTVREWLEVN